MSYYSNYSLTLPYVNFDEEIIYFLKIWIIFDYMPIVVNL